MSTEEPVTVTGTESPDGGPAYAATWLKDESLEALNLRIHDGAPVEALLDRARSYRDRLFMAFPQAAPESGSRVMELGSGVGWIMEAMLERFSVAEIVGLDISANMITRAQERFADPRARFTLYDGLHMPFPDGSFDVIYSVAAMQHIEKHIAFLLFEEIHRVLSPGGHAVIHLLAVDHIPDAQPDYHNECWNHVRSAPEHWHHYYSFDELFVLFSQVIGVTDLDIVAADDFRSFFVHFSSGTENRFLRPDLPSYTFRNRAGPNPSPRPAGQLVQSAARVLPEAVKPFLRKLRDLGVRHRPSRAP
jgi:ubiquinone/menaquinone biosynthesis C-methylase UbiE